MGFVSLDSLAPGVVVAQDVVDQQGRLLIPAGATLSERHLSALQRWGIALIHVKDAGGTEGAAAEAPPPPPEVVVHARHLYAHTDREHPVTARLLAETTARLAKEGLVNDLSLAPISSPPDPARPLAPLFRWDSADALACSVATIGSPPAIYRRLTELMNHPTSSAKDFAAVLRDDPGLTARLLRLVNSAFYGFPRKIDTISRAITIVGTDQLRDLALATSVMRMFDRVTASHVTMADFWRHSIACGVCARVLAALRQERNIESFFVAGLLHDIGSVAIYMRNADEAHRALATARRHHQLLHRVEVDTMGFNHADVGRALLEAWNLPPTHWEIVKYHHRPQRATRYPVEVATIHVADVVASAMRLGSSGETLIPPLEPAAWQTLGLADTTLPVIIAEVQHQYDSVVDILLMDEDE